MESNAMREKSDQIESNHNEIDTSLPKAVTEKEAARILSLSVQTLRNNRHQHKGLPYIKLGRSVRYLTADLINHLQTNRINPG
jgi:hypothetical protein